MIEVYNDNHTAGILVVGRSINICVVNQEHYMLDDNELRVLKIAIDDCLEAQNQNSSKE